jgi:hypothetical protein
MGRLQDDKLMRLNRVRCHQQAVFFSDIIDTSGMAIVKKYFKQRERGEAWFIMIFPQELPLAKDFQFCTESIQQVALQGNPRHRLGSFIASGHKIWEW